MIEYDYVTTRRADVRPIPQAVVPIVRFLMHWATRLNVARFRVSSGRMMNRFLEGYPCAVNTSGAGTEFGKPNRTYSSTAR
jgi:hypothetical protein